MSSSNPPPPPASNPRRRMLSPDSVVPPEVSAALRKLEHELGTRAAAKQVSCDREVLLRMIAGLPVRAGSLVLADRWYREHVGSPRVAAKAVPRRRARNAA